MATQNTPLTFKKLPGVLSFQRCFNVSDGEMLNLMPDGQTQPVEVVRHGIRGTQNVADGSGKTAKGGERNVSNIQVTETAKLNPSAQALVVQFGFRAFDLDKALCACASSDTELMQGMRESITSFIQRAKSGEAVNSIAKRLARNIANGRWLWRNRISAARISTTVRSGDHTVASFDSLAVPLNHFEEISQTEDSVARVIADGLQGNSLAGLRISAELSFNIAGAVEVFPSQNYVENKPTGFARPLYKMGGSMRPPLDKEGGFNVVGYAGVRDQKISNALRTIDTWYADYGVLKRPIAVEPMGASLDLMAFKRETTTGAFHLLRRLNQIDPHSPEGLFVLACMIRGGVFSESDKPGKAAATNESPEAESAEA